MATLAEKNETAAGSHEVSRRQIRGSTMLVFGRVLSMAINFLAQLLVVRDLTTADYGLWAYVISVVAFCEGFSTLGLGRAITRFIPIYHERGEYRKVLGTIVLAFATALLVCLLIVAIVYAAPHQLARFLAKGHDPIPLLLVLILLVPIEGIDGLMMGLFASFSGARAIFIRRFVLGPSLRLIAVLALIASHGGVRFLAIGYVAASLLGVIIYTWLLIRQLREIGLLTNVRLQEIEIPVREVFAFTIPLLTTDLVTVVNNSVVLLLLGYYHGTTAVAYYRVVLPAAMLNTLVMTGFAMMYTPSAARLFARNDAAGINHIYWQTAVWMGALSFPIFAATFCFARPVTVFLYGHRYEQSATILALLSLGNFISVVSGFNGLTLKVVGQLKYMVTINIIAALSSVVFSVLLIPRYGLLGGALSATGAIALHNVLKQAGLRLISGVRLFEREYTTFYLVMAFSSVGLFLLRFLKMGVWVDLLLAGLASLLVLVASRKALRIGYMFPEVQKIPLMRRFFVV